MTLIAARYTKWSINLIELTPDDGSRNSNSETIKSLMEWNRIWRTFWQAFLWVFELQPIYSVTAQQQCAPSASIKTDGTHFEDVEGIIIDFFFSHSLAYEWKNASTTTAHCHGSWSPDLNVSYSLAYQLVSTTNKLWTKKRHFHYATSNLADETSDTPYTGFEVALAPRLDHTFDLPQQNMHQNANV